MTLDAIVIGAGVAGLECARRLHAAGRRVRVLDRAHGVGGRCATRRFDGQPVDTGPAFLHGNDRGFLDAVEGVDGATPLRGWPHRIEGRGAPCQPSAFAPGEARVAFAEGLSVFPKRLARGLDVQLATTVTHITVPSDARAHSLRVELSSGEALDAADVVIALPVEQSAALLRGIAEVPELAGGNALLGMFASVPSLTVVVGYDLDAPAPAWDMLFPEDSDVLQLIAHDSAKRAAPRAHVLVLQARPRWSRPRLEVAAERWLEEWAAEMITDAASRLGSWVSRPRFTHPHRWRFARLERDNELAQPLCISLAGGQRVCVAGDLFAPGGGVQAAWISGSTLATRLLAP